MKYRTLLITASATLLFNIGTATAEDTNNDYDDLELEPCLNSEISARGDYAFERSDNSIALEPAINGEVSADGRFASEAAALAYQAERG